MIITHAVDLEDQKLPTLVTLLGYSAFLKRILKHKL